MTSEDAASDQITPRQHPSIKAPIPPVEGNDPETAHLNASPIKGFAYEATVHPVLETIAARLGDEYVNTSRTPGYIPNCKKGDGLLIITDLPGLPAGGARVVFEMSDSRAGSRRWNPYLEESEQNRGAHASIALVRHRSQVPGGKDTRAYGSRRIVIAFDPTIDDPDDVLSTAVTLVRNRAVFEAIKTGTASSEVAAGSVADARRLLEELPEIRMLAARAQTLAGHLVARIDSVHSKLDRQLVQATDALREASNPYAAKQKGPA